VSWRFELYSSYKDSLARKRHVAWVKFVYRGYRSIWITEECKTGYYDIAEYVGSIAKINKKNWRDFL